MEGCQDERYKGALLGEGAVHEEDHDLTPKLDSESAKRDRVQRTVSTIGHGRITANSSSFTISSSGFCKANVRSCLELRSILIFHTSYEYISQAVNVEYKGKSTYKELAYLPFHRPMTQDL
jgi:hypothetical protein